MILILGPAYLVGLVLVLRRDFLRTLGAIAIAAVSAGILYWTVPYTRMKLLEGIFPLAFAGLAVIAGLAIRRWAWLAWPKVAGVAGLGFVTAVMARVIFDTFVDPETHNLFFLEVIFGFVFGFAGATIAAGVTAHGRNAG
jgi:hypothetical protein